MDLEIESMIEICREHSENVKRWRDGTMALRWRAAGMVEVGRQFRCVNGHLRWPKLYAALDEHFTGNSPPYARIRAGSDMKSNGATTEVLRDSGHRLPRGLRLLRRSTMHHRFLKGLAAGAILATAGVLLAVLPGSAGAQGSTSWTSYPCTGMASDGTTIASDLTALAQGGTLYLTGTCGSATTTISVSVPQGVTLAGSNVPGDNGGSQIDGSVSSASSGPITIRGIAVNCEGESSSAGFTISAFRAKIEDNSTRNCAYGLEYTNPSGGNGNEVNSQIIGNMFSVNAGSGYPLWINDSGNGITDGLLEGNWLDGGSDAINSSNLAGWTIIGNHLYAHTGYGIKGTRAYGTRIIGNYIEQWANGDAGIQITQQPGSQGSVIADNQVDENDQGTAGGAGAGIAVFANGCSSTNQCYAAVDGNMIVNTAPSDTSNYGIEGSGAGLVYTSAGNNVQGANAATKTLNGATKGTAV
jgi:hypothetical protein